MVSDTQYVRYFAEPEKHPHQVDFYKTLFAKGDLIKTFQPRKLWPYPDNRFTKYHIHISPTIKVYQINNGIEILVNNLIDLGETEKKRVAVIDLVNYEGETEKIDKYISEQITTQLVNTKTLSNLIS